MTTMNTQLNEHGSQTRERVRALVVAAGCAAMLCGGAFGADKAPLRLKASINATGNAEPVTTTRSTTVIVKDGREIKVVTEGDKEPVVTVDGKTVPNDRIENDDGRITILDENGATLAVVMSGREAGEMGRSFTLNLGNADLNRALEAARMGHAWMNDGEEGDGQNNVWAMAGEAKPPKVMLGVTMTSPSDDLRQFAGLEEGQGVVISHVTEGLPAGKGGLKVGDLVLKADGQSVDESDLRELLRKKEPGEELKLSILRKGQPQEVALKLEAYDAKKLGMGGNVVVNSARSRNMGSAQQALAEARRAIEGANLNAQQKAEALAEISKAMAEIEAETAKAAGDADEARARADEARERAAEIRKNLQSKYNLKMPRGTVTRIGPGAPPGVPDFPSPPTAPNAPMILMDRDNSQLSERLQTLESKLDRLERLLDRLADSKDEKKKP